MLHSLIGLPQDVDCTPLFFILLPHQGDLVIQILNLILQQVDVELSCSHVIFKLSFHTFMLGLLHLKLFDFALQ